MFKQEIISACIVVLSFSCELDIIPDEITFEKTFGGTNGDGGLSVQQTQDGGYIITGYTNSNGAGQSDVYLIKTDVNGEIDNSNGNIAFEMPFGRSSHDVGLSVHQTQDRGYIVAGSSGRAVGGERDVYLIKTVPNGNIEREKVFRGYYHLRSVQQTRDEGYIMTGSDAEGDVYLIKTDANGNKEFEKPFGGANSDVGLSVQQTRDGGYIITGYTYSKGAGESDVYLIKTDANGDAVNTNGIIGFERTFGGSESDIGNAVHQTVDGGYIITGYTATEEYFLQAFNVYLIKTDSVGNKIFERKFGGLARDVGNAVQQTEDGGYIITGYTESIGAGGLDVYLIKTDPDGNMVFEKPFGGTATDVGNAVQQTEDKGYIITGSTESKGAGGNDLYLIKTNAYGEVEQ